MSIKQFTWFGNLNIAWFYGCIKKIGNTTTCWNKFLFQYCMLYIILVISLIVPNEIHLLPMKPRVANEKKTHSWLVPLGQQSTHVQSQQSREHRCLNAGSRGGCCFFSCHTRTLRPLDNSKQYFAFLLTFCIYFVSLLMI